MTGFWSDRPVFVTGGTGLVGSWLVRALVDKGASVVCLVRDWVPESELVRSGLFSCVCVVRGDVRDQKAMERVLGEYEVDTVFHLAAQTIVPIANRNPVSTFDTNIRGTWALLEACRRSPSARQIVVASSDKAYGSQEVLPYTEETPLAGEHPYDASKSCADLIATSYAKTFGVPVAITRCGNFYGGGDLNWSRIVPGTIRSVMRGTRPVIRSDGQFIRDYFYVEDGATALMTLAEAMVKDASLRGEAFNFSNELHIPVSELATKILRLMGSSLECEILGEASNEIRDQSLSAAKARSRLGWRPRFSLDEGLAKTVEWYREFFENGSRTAAHTP
ncbi:MAG: NAD-dependent epimerase/dehydratase family protein [Gemmatimonadetes bacterium]|nr:NAD-dependent epimerase/dehydratase family protein [Gemmatimonadota bacterium]